MYAYVHTSAFVHKIQNKMQLQQRGQKNCRVSVRLKTTDATLKNSDPSSYVFEKWKTFYFT